MADDHSDLAEAMDNLGTAISNVAASTPSGAPHAMVWVEKAKMAIASWRAKFMPQPEVEDQAAPQPSDPPVDEAGSDDSQDAEQPGDSNMAAPAWSPPAA